MLHRSSNDAVVKDNYSHDNGDAGLALFESSDCTVEDNVFENNKCQWVVAMLGSTRKVGHI